MNIEDVRKNIDTVDKQLIKLLAVRVAYAAQIAELKRKQGTDSAQPERSHEMIQERQKFAAELGVPEDLINDVFKAINIRSQS